jgi:hypothetical protein
MGCDLQSRGQLKQMSGVEINLRVGHRRTSSASKGHTRSSQTVISAP